MKKVLITGAGGFIGSHLTELMVASGYEVRAMVRYNSGADEGWLSEVSSDIRGQFEIVYGDVRDFGSTRENMRNCQAVLHLAALIGIPYSYVAPSSYVDTNITGTLNVVQAARELGVLQVIQTSTSEVYGTAITVPINENHLLQGQSPYSASKIAADQMALSYYRSFNLPVTVIRPFNTYGPRQSLRAIVPTIISQVLYGDGTIRLGSLRPTRDLSFVTDTAAAFMATLTNPSTVGETINVGTGYEISIGDLVSVIARLMGRDVTVYEDTQRTRPEKSEVERLLADASKAKSLMNWTPSFHGQDGLERGLLETISWFRNHDGAKRHWEKYQV